MQGTSDCLDSSGPYYWSLCCLSLNEIWPNDSATQFSWRWYYLRRGQVPKWLYTCQEWDERHHSSWRYMRGLRSGDQIVKSLYDHAGHVGTEGWGGGGLLRGIRFLTLYFPISSQQFDFKFSPECLNPQLWGGYWNTEGAPTRDMWTHIVKASD